MMKMNEQPLEDTMMEVKEDFMLSPAGDSDPTLRTAHFLKPIASSIEEEPAFKCNPFSSSSSSVFEPTLETHFRGWRYTQHKWVSWFDQLKPKYESVWKKAGIFDAIMSTKCYIHKNYNLLYGVVDKWCCETNTFVFPFGEATITLEDVMVLGGYPVLGDPVFISIEDQEMREVEKELILALKQLTTNRKTGGDHRRTLWMDIFIDKGSEIEHEAFLATWLSIFVFPDRISVKSSLFPIAVHLARGNPVALAPAVLASIYKDLTLFKKTIVDLSKCPVGGDRFHMVVTLQSPFYLVQIWVWERFKNLQPQPMLINHGEPFLFRWHRVQALKIDNVKLALDSAVDDFIWRPYVRYSNKYGMFYPNDETLVPFKKDLEKEMLSFVTCLRVSELVGFESIEQYFPHRVSMQFGLDQDVPSYVTRFNETKSIAWKNYCRPISDKSLYFPPRLFEADVTTRYAKWWKQLVIGRDDFVKNTVKRKRSASSRKHRIYVGKTDITGSDVGLGGLPGFPPSLVDTLIFGKFCADGSKTKTRKVDENSVDDCSRAAENIDAHGPSSLPPKHNILVPSISVEDCSASSADYEKMLPLKRPVSEDNIEFSIQDLEDEFKDANKSKRERICTDKVSSFSKVFLSRSEFGDFISSNVGSEIAGCGNEDEIKSPFYDRNDVNDINEEGVGPFILDMTFDLENRVQKLERVISKLKEARLGQKVEIV